MTDQINYAQTTTAATGENLQNLYNHWVKNFDPALNLNSIVAGKIPGLESPCDTIDTGVNLPPLEIRPNGAPAPRLTPEQEKSSARETLSAIAGADLSTYGQPSREAQAVVKEFLAQKDPGAALQKCDGAFNKVIEGADNTYTQIKDKHMPAVQEAKKDYIAVNTEYNREFFRVSDAAEKLPPGMKEKAREFLAHVALEGTELPGRAELTSTYRGQKEFIEKMVGLAQKQGAVIAAGDRLDNAGKPILDAALEQDRARIAYERAAQTAGNFTRAHEIDKDRGRRAEQTKDLLGPPTELSLTRY